MDIDPLRTKRNNNVLEIVLAKGKSNVPGSPFIRWHLKTKFELIKQLYHRYLYPGCRFIDIACGDGDGLVLARHCQPECELWGVDIDDDSLNIAKSRVPEAKVFKGDMLNMEFLPEGHFDVLHEFAASFLVRDWKTLVNQYLRLVRDGGIILWELPEKWSAAHLMYLFTIAPKITENDTKIKRILRSFIPSKYVYLSNPEVDVCLKASDYAFEMIEHVPIWYFYCHGIPRIFLDYLHRFFGDRLFETLDRFNRLVWPRYSGYYLVIRKKHKK